jgi:hypothetical protein
MADTTHTPLTCKCGKVYKTQRPYLNHIHKCQLKSTTNTQSNSDTTDNVTIQSEEKDTPAVVGVQPTDDSRIKKHLAPDPEYLAQIDNDMKNDLHQFMNSERPLPKYEPIEGENITVNTLVIETLLKTVLSQVLLHHHRHTQNIIEQNNKLIDENKMLVRMVRTMIYTQNNIKYEIDVPSDDDDEDAAKHDGEDEDAKHDEADAAKPA